MKAPASNYGSTAHAGELRQLLDHLITVNTEAERRGRHKTPLCIWGRHGLGKTELVEAYARERGYAWAYLAPAQFEEMGDLLGMPQIDGQQTRFAPPQWVPTQPGPGILLIDDVNRADGRILNGIMQLLQHYELHSWRLPAQWHILLTANPDQGDYTVTPLDQALLTRMMHVTMVFDAAQWARWAAQRGIDERCIAFVLAQPKVAEGHRSSPRTLVQFFEALAPIESWEVERGLVQMLGEACLDTDTVAAFMDFLDQGMGRLPGPQTILDSLDFEREVAKPLRTLTNGKLLRSDLLSAICIRLAQQLQQAAPTTAQLANVKAFLSLDYLPAELRLLFAQDLMASPHSAVKALFADPEISRLLL
ncbi:MAG: AAA family ATPase [Bacteroidota bacterium]